MARPAIKYVLLAVRLRSSSGAVLPVVLVFAVFALIVASLYIAAQFTIGKPALVGPASFQALCNARSGIWKGIHLLRLPPPDTLAKINTLDSMFNKQIFGNSVSISPDNSSYFTPGDTAPTGVQPYSVDSFGRAEVSLDYQPCYKVLASKGEFRTANKSVRAFLGGKVYASPDTVLFLVNGFLPEGGVVEGEKVVRSSPKDSSAATGLSSPPDSLSRTGVSSQSGSTSAVASKSSAAPQPSQTAATAPEQLRMGEIAKVVSYYRSLLFQKTDSTLPGRLLTIQSGDDCASVPEVVNGSLFLSAAVSPLVWREKRRVFVFGDLQITGETSVECVEFVTTGDITILDESKLRNVSLFGLKRLVIGDKASFSGNALMLSSVLVYNNARIDERSVVVSYGSAPADTTRKKTPFSISLKQDATVDGVLIACGSPGGISTDRNVMVRGVLWATGPILHQGALFGILRASELVDPQTMQARQNGSTPPLKNTLTGSIRRLPEVINYPFPFFMGTLLIARWDEG